MKTTIKNTIGILALSLFSLGVSAQSTTTTNSNSASTGIIWSAGVNGGLSTGNFKDSHKWSLGGSLQADIPVAKQFYLTVNAGYDNFYGKSNYEGTGISAPDIHLLPAMAGIKFFPIPMLYLQADAGAGFLLNKDDLGYNKTAAFLYAPEIGLQFPIGGKSYIDAGVKYEGTTKFESGDTNSKINTLGLRIAYAFGTK